MQCNVTVDFGFKFHGVSGLSLAVGVEIRYGHLIILIIMNLTHAKRMRSLFKIVFLHFSMTSNDHESHACQANVFSF